MAFSLALFVIPGVHRRVVAKQGEGKTTSLTGSPRAFHADRRAQAASRLRTGRRIRQAHKALEQLGGVPARYRVPGRSHMTTATFACVIPARR
jgi:hypothetical protein